jgi:hypothetical protein
MTEKITRKGKGRDVPLSDTEQSACEELSRLWKLNAKPLAITQAGLGKKYGCNASNISQIINGFIPLNLLWLNRFAKELRVDPEDIMPEYREFFKLGAQDDGEDEGHKVLRHGFIRRGPKAMPDINRTPLSMTLPIPGCLAVEILFDAQNIFDLRYGCYVVFDPREKPTPNDQMAVATAKNASDVFRIVRPTKDGWVDVFDGFLCTAGTYDFKRRVGVLYMA